MWSKLKKNHPWLYEAEEWAVLGLSMGAFAIALTVKNELSAQVREEGLA